MGERAAEPQPRLPPLRSARFQLTLESTVAEPPSAVKDVARRWCGKRREHRGGSAGCVGGCTARGIGQCPSPRIVEGLAHTNWWNGLVFSTVCSCPHRSQQPVTPWPSVYANRHHCLMGCRRHSCSPTVAQSRLDTARRHDRGVDGQGNSLAPG